MTAIKDIGGGRIRDGYTGYFWCGNALHLITPENASRQGQCLACQRTATAKRRTRRRALGLKIT